MLILLSRRLFSLSLKPHRFLQIRKRIDLLFGIVSNLVIQGQVFRGLYDLPSFSYFSDLIVQVILSPFS
jgi:hypothetical protein